MNISQLVTYYGERMSGWVNALMVRVNECSNVSRSATVEINVRTHLYTNAQQMPICLNY